MPYGTLGLLRGWYRRVPYGTLGLERVKLIRTLTLFVDYSILAHIP